MDNLSKSVNESADMQNTERIFKCELCIASFNIKGKLMEHKISVHGGKTTFSCEICYVSFAKRYNLNRHLSTVHEEKDPFNNR